MKMLTCMVALMAFGCGSDSSTERTDTLSAAMPDTPMGDAIIESGVVTSAWSEFCIAEFTSDYSVKDFGEEIFTARAGERYLVENGVTSGIGLDGPRVYAELVFLSKTGPFSFEVEASDRMKLPITNPCENRQTDMYFAVFSDTTFYVDDALTDEACTLPAGIYAMGGGGYFSGGEGSLALRSDAQPQIFRINMTSLADLCNGHSETYISVAPSGSSLAPHRVPVRVIVGPEQPSTLSPSVLSANR
ncbi:MAG: hypothetical protein VX589_12650 [Myxococcota bacterium]|nr:hypothetical protein [Myxococcota bacterium]